MSKTAEALLFNRNVFTNDLTKILEIVKQFMIDNELILFGGQALHHLFELKGDELYSDFVMPDYDFLSPKHIEHAYELKKILLDKGYDSDAIVALHPQTIRLRYNFYFVADIGHIPEKLYQLYKSTSLNYNGILLVNPNLQRIDMNLSLSRPYMGEPRHNIFNRLKKDIVRFNKLIDLYPIQDLISMSNTKYEKEIALFDDVVYTGFVAYSYLCKIYSDICDKLKKKKNPLIPLHKFKISDQLVKFENLLDEPGIFFAIDPSKYPQVKPKKYERVMDYKPRSIHCQDYIIYELQHNQISINTFEKINFANIQMVMVYFMYLMYFEDKSWAINYYNALMLMIQEVQEYLPLELFLKSPFSVSIDVYGNDNIAEGMILREENKMDLLPKNYYHTDTSIPDLPKDYQDNEVFARDGREYN